ncbi:hypothetical protein B0H13DRAFT_1862259 [Mycena leptocephala]|nr:hypothetical protein B0H13DRAFT_1862259 [Mycena leptocephala]
MVEILLGDFLVLKDLFNCRNIPITGFEPPNVLWKEINTAQHFTFAAAIAQPPPRQFPAVPRQFPAVPRQSRHFPRAQTSVHRQNVTFTLPIRFGPNIRDILFLIGGNSVPVTVCGFRPLSGPWGQRIYSYDTTRMRLRVIDSRKDKQKTDFRVDLRILYGGHFRAMLTWTPGFTRQIEVDGGRDALNTIPDVCEEAGETGRTLARLVRNILAIEPKALSPAIQNPVTILTTSPAVQKTIRAVLSEIKRQADARGYTEFSSAISHITGDTMPPWPQLRDILNSFEDKAYGSFGEYVRASAGLNEIPFELRATCDIIRPSLAPNSSIIRTKLVESFNDVLDITPSLVPSHTIGQWARCARRQSNQLSSQTGTLGNCSEAEVLMRFDGGALPYNVMSDAIRGTLAGPRKWGDVEYELRLYVPPVQWYWKQRQTLGDISVGFCYRRWEMSHRKEHTTFRDEWLGAHRRHLGELQQEFRNSLDFSEFVSRTFQAWVTLRLQRTAKLYKCDSQADRVAFVQLSEGN